MEISRWAECCAVQEPVLFATSVRANIMQGSTGATEEDGFKLWHEGGLFEMLCIEKLGKS